MTELKIEVEPHPLLEACLFETEFPKQLAAMGQSEAAILLTKPDQKAPLTSSDEVRKAIRTMLRQDGFKPTGRSKPASEYLIKASGEQKLTPINLAVDILNAVSLHSGLPISVVDVELLRNPLVVKTANKGASYVFNSAGQAIDIGGLLCLFDNNGPCANAVKDSQRTKTRPETTRTLSIIWGSKELPDRVDQTCAWYRKMLEDVGAKTKVCGV